MEVAIQVQRGGALTGKGWERKVKHVHVHSGAQAVVGVVNHRARRGVSGKMESEPMNASPTNRQPLQFQQAPQCGARTKSGKPCRSPATRKGRCRLHGGASASGGPPGERNGQYRHGERTKGAIAERQKFSALLKMLRAGLT